MNQLTNLICYVPFPIKLRHLYICKFQFLHELLFIFSSGIHYSVPWADYFKSTQKCVFINVYLLTMCFTCDYLWWSIYKVENNFQVRNICKGNSKKRGKYNSSSNVVTFFLNSLVNSAFLFRKLGDKYCSV